ncbi:MAG: tryptophan synthase subunit alpha [bacterium]|nr:tryptophan synthase subunit alpha [bacterium]
MNRIDAQFARLRQSKRAGLIPYITAGDPPLPRTHQLVLALERAGADLIELGIPFSDPLADGKTNQEAAERALRNGVTLHDVLTLVHNLRRFTQVPIVFFTYLNPVFRYGFARFADAAAEAGVDGVLTLDMPPEEAAPLKQELDRAGVHTIFLAAPTSSDERLRSIATVASGFIYYVCRTGVTGERDTVPPDLPDQVARIRRVSPLPVAVGFGVAGPAHVAAIAKYADAVVVGSAIVRRIAEGGDSDMMVHTVESFVQQLAQTLLSPPS